MNIYYGLRMGKVTNKRSSRRGGKRIVPPFEDAVVMATPDALRKAIAHFERTTGEYTSKEYRIERMKQRLQELDAQVARDAAP